MTLQRLGLVSTRLHYFQMVARFGSIRRAAQALNTAPSAISRTIQHLEDELGAPLFERAKQRLKLTSAGEILVYHAGTSVSELERAKAFIDDLKGLRRGAVRIAAVESIARGLLPDVAAKFWKLHPDITIAISITDSRAAFDTVARAECDVAVGFDGPVPKAVRRQASATVNLGAVVNPAHPMAGKRTARLADFATDRVILSDGSLTLGSSLEAALAQGSTQLRPASTTNSIQLMAEFAARGLGVSFQTRVGVQVEVERKKLVFVPLTDPLLRARKLLVVTRAKAHLPAAPAAFSAMLANAILALDGQ